MFSRVNMIKIERVSNRGTLAGLYMKYILGYQIILQLPILTTLFSNGCWDIVKMICGQIVL